MQASLLRSSQLAVITFALSCSAAIAGTAETGAAPVAKISCVAVLGIVSALTLPEGDYETLGVIESLDASGFRVVTPAELPGNDSKPVQKIAHES